MKIGVFDSGIGGYTIYKPLRTQLPQHEYVYLNDKKNNPYSEKSVQDLQKICHANVQSLIDQNCQVIVVACNTATIICLEYLRRSFPKIKFVGTIPAVKPASQLLPAGSHVLVMATKNTVNSQYLHDLVEPYQTKTKFSFLGSTKLVELIEADDQPGIKRHLEQILSPYHQDKLAGIVFGCTHFPLIKEQIKQILDYQPRFFDSAQGVIDQLQRVINKW